MSIWMIWCKVKIRLSCESSRESFLVVSVAIRYVIDLGCLCRPSCLIKLLALNWPSRLFRAIPGRWYSRVIDPWQREGKQKGDITQNKFRSAPNGQVSSVCSHKMADVAFLLTGNANEKNMFKVYFKSSNIHKKYKIKIVLNTHLINLSSSRAWMRYVIPFDTSNFSLQKCPFHPLGK